MKEKNVDKLKELIKELVEEKLSIPKYGIERGIAIAGWYYNEYNCFLKEQDIENNISDKTVIGIFIYDILEVFRILNPILEESENQQVTKILKKELKFDFSKMDKVCSTEKIVMNAIFNKKLISVEVMHYFEKTTLISNGIRILNLSHTFLRLFSMIVIMILSGHEKETKEIEIKYTAAVAIILAYTQIYEERIKNDGGEINENIGIQDLNYEIYKGSFRKEMDDSCEDKKYNNVLKDIDNILEYVNYTFEDSIMRDLEGYMQQMVEKLKEYYGNNVKEIIELILYNAYSSTKIGGE
ncbi:MAG: hypothetical protein IKW30_11965 [Lachnospiraceae bacterium]|nr:hypothetical protein [Lachnospiraceae bacterium]